VVCEGVGLGVGVDGGDDSVGVGVGLGAGADDDDLLDDGCGLGALLDELLWLVDGVLLPVVPLLGLAPGVVDDWPGLALRPCDGLADGLADGVPLGLGLGLADGDVDEVEVVAADEARWLNRFMKPTTPTALSKVARQVSTDTRRSPLSRRATSRSRYLMSANESARHVKRLPRTTQGLVPSG